jgi:hypothetical protein
MTLAQLLLSLLLYLYLSFLLVHFKTSILMHIAVVKVTGSTPSVEEVLAISKHCVQQVRSSFTLFGCW